MGVEENIFIAQYIDGRRCRVTGFLSLSITDICGRTRKFLLPETLCQEFISLDAIRARDEEIKEIIKSTRNSVK